MRTGKRYGRRRTRVVNLLAMVAPAAAAALLPAASARADQVVLKNGDKLDGHVVGLDGGKLTINVVGLGDVKVDVGQIVTFNTDAPVDLRLSDGTSVKQKVDAVPAGGSVRIEGGLVPASQDVPLGQIKQINPPPPPPWTGSIAAGALLIRGNTQTDSLNLAANLSRKTEQWDATITGAYLYGRTHDRNTGNVTTTAENWQAEARYDYNFTKQFYGFADMLVRKDRIAQLDLRLVPSGGVGYRFFDTPDFKLSTEAGLAWVYERYTNSTPIKEDFSATLAYHVTKKFNDVLSVFHDLQYLPSLERGRDFIVDTDVGVHAQFNKHLFGEAKITLDYDSHPANGALKTDVFYALNLGYNL